VSAFFKHSDPEVCDCANAAPPDVCITTVVLISAAQDLVSDRVAGGLPPEGYSPARVGLTLLVEDTCSGRQFVRGSSLNTVPDDQVEISGRMAFARVLVPEFQFENLVTAAVEPVSIDLAWNPSGPRYQLIGGNPDARHASAHGSVVIESAWHRRELIANRTFAAYFNQTTVGTRPGVALPISPANLAEPFGSQ
jgi:hypothetical protein